MSMVRRTGQDISAGDLAAVGVSDGVGRSRWGAVKLDVAVAEVDLQLGVLGEELRPEVEHSRADWRVMIGEECENGERGPGVGMSGGEEVVAEPDLGVTPTASDALPSWDIR